MVMENILKFENGSRSLLIQPGFRSLLFHASHDEMMTSVREGLADHIHNLPPTGATEVGEEPEEEIGAVTRESEHSKGIGSTLSETEVAAIPTQELAGYDKRGKTGRVRNGGRFPSSV